jgi:hypothetical protein
MDLRQRGIEAEARQAGWTPLTLNVNGVKIIAEKYPIYNPLTNEIIGHRATLFNKADVNVFGRKYWWSPSKPESKLAEWYILPSAVKAIQDAGGVAYLANGEKSLLAYVAAGVYNVVATTHTEQRIPDLTMLKNLGVTHLINPFDNDNAGRDSAVKWVDVCEIANITYEMRQWTTDTPKYDAGDLWIECGFDANKFKQALQDTAIYVAPKRVVTPKEKKVYLGHEDLATKIANALGKSGDSVKANGYTKNFACPMGTHEDSNPSAGLHMATGIINCFACGVHSPIAVAERLGIALTEYVAPTIKPVKASNSTKETYKPLPADEIELPKVDLTVLKKHIEMLAGGGDVWFNEMSMVWHSILNTIHQGDGQLTMYINELINDGALDGRDFTVNELIEATGRNERTIRAWLNRYENVLINCMDDTRNIVSKIRTSSVPLNRGGQSRSYKTIVPNAIELLKLASQVIKQDVFKDTLATLDPLLLELLQVQDSEPLELRRKKALENDAQRMADRIFKNRVNTWAYRLQNEETPMPIMMGWQRLTVDEYSKLYVTARIEANGGSLTIGQEALGSELGVTASSMGRVLRAMPLKITENLEYYTIPKGMRGENAMLTASKTMRGRVIKWTVWHGDNLLQTYPAYEGMAQSINKKMKENPAYIIKLVVQCVNTYSFAPQDDIETEVDIQVNTTENAKKVPSRVKNSTPIANDTVKEIKQRKTRVWIEQIEDNDKTLYTSEWLANQVLAYCGLAFNETWQVVSKHDQSVVFEKADYVSLVYLMNNIAEFLDADYNTIAPIFSYTVNAEGQVVNLGKRETVLIAELPEVKRSNLIQVEDANGNVIDIPF